MFSMRAFLIPLAAAAVAAGAARAATGSIWKVEPTVNPAATQLTNSSLASVSASGPAEAWSVGTFMDVKALDHPLAEHRAGGAWTRVPVPQPPGQQALLSAVDDLSPASAWAVGTSFSGGSGANPAGKTLIEHWNGTRWSIVPRPNPAAGPGDANVLDAITGTGPNDLWAAGWDHNAVTDTISLLFEHWNGTAWKAVTSPTPIKSAQFAAGITAVGPTNVWAVGSDQTRGPKTLAAHWNGTAWSIVPTPSITNAGNAQNSLTGVSSDAAGDVWASGFADNVNGNNFRVPYVLHWTGTAWTMTKVPNLGTEGSRLNGIQVLSPTDAWAVGQTQASNGSISTLTEQFNGTAWSISPSPDPGSVGNLIDNSLASVARAGGSNLFAVGARETQGQCCLRTLALGTAQG